VPIVSAHCRSLSGAQVSYADRMSRSRLRLVANSCDPRRPLLNGGSRSPHGNSSFGRAQRRVQLQRWVCSGDAVFRRVTLTACLIRFRPAINQSKRLRVSLFPCIAAAAASPADAEPRVANRGTRRQQLQPATAGWSSWATRMYVCGPHPGDFADGRATRDANET